MRSALCSLLLAAALAGCSASPAAVDLIAAARAGLAQARRAEAQRQALEARGLEAQAAALDAAFDADVRAVAAGQVGPAGDPTALSPEWVISARRAYATTLRALAQQQLRDQAAGAERLDNLAAADEALEMAGDLLVRQLQLAEPVRRRLMDIHGRWIDGD